MTTVEKLVEETRRYLSARSEVVPWVDGKPISDVIHDIDMGSRGHRILLAATVRELVDRLESEHAARVRAEEVIAEARRVTERAITWDARNPRFELDAVLAILSRAEVGE